jgi:peptidoglycan/xylan/chitin deacetylase (PgdA/CDA1 family)
MNGVNTRVLEVVARAVRSRRSVIFCYHGVGPLNLAIDPSVLRIDPASFRTQLELLLRGGFEFVTVAEFAERSAGDRPPPGLVALSFDDGMDDNHSHVMPTLREYGVTATFYVTTGLMGKPNPWLAQETGSRMMTVEELRDLAAAGFEIGAHTVTHPDLSLLSYDECLREAYDSRVELERLLGISVETFAYPFCEYGPHAIAAVKDAGFAAAVTCGAGVGSWSPFELPRSIISRLDGRSMFALKLSGLHPPLFLSRPGRLVRGATRSYRNRRRDRREGRRYSAGARDKG